MLLAAALVRRRRPLPSSLAAAHRFQAPLPPALSTIILRGLANVPSHALPPPRTLPPVPDANLEGLQQRLLTHELARKEEAEDAWKANVVAEALTTLRGEGGPRKSKGSVAHRQALLTLGHYGGSLEPADALRVIHQALEQQGLGKVAFTTYQELSKRPEGVTALLHDADALLLACCRAEKHRMAMMVVTQVQEAHFEAVAHQEAAAAAAAGRETYNASTVPPSSSSSSSSSSPTSPPLPIFSRDASLAVLRLLGERDRYQHHWRFAEDMVKDKRLPGAPVDVEVIAAAMVVSWKAQKWASVQRLSAFLAGKGGVPEPVLLDAGQVGKEEGREEGEERGEVRRVVGGGLSAYALKDWKTMMTLRSMTEVLRRREGARVEKVAAGVAAAAAAVAAGGGGGGSKRVTRRRHAVVTTPHVNMLLYALLKVGQVSEAQILVASMLQQANTTPSSLPSSSSLPLPGPDALSLSMVMDALGRKGNWQGALQLLNDAQALPTPPSPAALRLLYKTAIAALGKERMWEGALSLFYEMHERGVPADAQVYTALLKALKEGGRLDSAFEFLGTMKAQKITPTRPTYNVLFSFLGKEGRVEEALKLFREMKEALGLKGSPYDYGTLISACGKAVMRCGGVEGGREGEVEGLVARAEELLKEILEEGMPGAAAASSSSSSMSDVFLPSSYSSSSSFYQSTGTSIPSSSSSSSSRIQDGGLGNCYTQLFKVYGKAGQWEKALALLEHMRRDGYVEPSASHYYEAMRACAFAQRPDAALALLKEVKEVERRREGGRGRPHILCWNAAVLACQRAGRWLACLELLKTMEGLGQEPGPSNYARAMQACGEAGRGDEAWKLYQELVQRQQGSSRGALDHVVYGSLLLVCGKAGEVERVKTLWGDMCQTRNFVPDRLNVAQAVAALAWGCGQIEEARAMLLPLSKEGRGGGGGRRGVVGKGEEERNSTSSSSLLAFHVLMLAVLKHGAPGGKSVSGACQELVDEMMEAHGLCPTSTTKALLARAGCDVSGLFVEEEEVGGWEAAEARVLELLALNPHDARKRERVCGE